MKKLNGTNFELLNVNMQYFLVDQDLLVAVSKTKPIGMKDEEWRVLDRNVTILISIFLADSMSINVFKESTIAHLWITLGDL